LNCSQVHDILNKYDNGSGQLSYPEFRRILHRKVREADLETNYKESFRVFSKANTEHIKYVESFDLNFSLNFQDGKGESSVGKGMLSKGGKRSVKKALECSSVRERGSSGS
jgi:hypothetical protein